MRAWAIVVGINDYPVTAGQRPLNGAVADALDFADWALHANGGAVAPEDLYLWTYPPPAVALLTPALTAYLARPTPWWNALGAPQPPAARAPTVQEIFQTALIAAEKALEALNETGDDGCCYILFAGHGVQAQVKGSTRPPQTCFLTGDFQGSSAPTGLLPTEDFRDGLMVSGFSRVFMFLDCCRLDYVTTNARAAPLNFPDGLYPPQPMWGAAFAASRNAAAWETPCDAPTRGAFTKIVVEGLRRLRNRDDNSLSLHKLEDYVWTRIGEAVKPNQQFPKFDGEPNTRQAIILQAPEVPLDQAEIMQDIVIDCRGVAPGVKFRLLDNSDVERGAFETNGDFVRIPAAIGQPYTVESEDGAIERGVNHYGPGASDAIEL